MTGAEPLLGALGTRLVAAQALGKKMTRTGQNFCTDHRDRAAALISTGGIEPPTFCVLSRRHNRLDHVDITEIRGTVSFRVLELSYSRVQTAVYYLNATSHDPEPDAATPNDPPPALKRVQPSTSAGASPLATIVPA